MNLTQVFIPLTIMLSFFFFIGYRIGRQTTAKEIEMLLANTERGLTTDAPEMTVGDSSPVNEQNLDNSGGKWYCIKCDKLNLSVLKECWNCQTPRPETTAKPE